MSLKLLAFVAALFSSVRLLPFLELSRELVLSVVEVFVVPDPVLEPVEPAGLELMLPDDPEEEPEVDVAGLDAAGLGVAGFGGAGLAAAGLGAAAGGLTLIPLKYQASFKTNFKSPATCYIAVKP